MPYRLDQNIREDGILEKMSDILSLFANLKNIPYHLNLKPYF